MGKEYRYIIYGFVVQSEICLPEAYPTDCLQQPDVYVKEGIMPDHIREEIQQGRPSHWYSKDDAWFFTARAGAYRIQNASQIIVERDCNSDEGMVRAMLLGAALAHVLTQRNILAIHGSGIVYNSKAFIISGSSGAGKSTIVHECMKDAEGFLSDDTVVIDFTKEGIKAVPAYPQQKLCEDMAVRAGYDLTKLNRLGEECLKFAINRTNQFINVPTILGGMIILGIGKEDNVQVTEIQGKEKLDCVFSNLYLDNLYRYIGVKPEFMKKTIEFAMKVPIYKITRPVGKDTIELVKEKIDSIVR